MKSFWDSKISKLLLQNIKNKTYGEETKFGDFTDEFTSRLKDGSESTHSVPLTSPEGNVGSIVLILTSECQADEKLIEPTLNVYNSKHTGESLGETETREIVEDDVENEKHDDGDGMGNRSKH